jgi:hypothetical protein
VISVRWIAFILAALIPALGYADNDQLDAFSWLEGSWTRETKRGTSVETWSRVSEVTMEGIVTLQQGEALVVTEHLRLELMGDEVFYVAKPRENAFPTAFRLVERDAVQLVFQNPTHDFPQQIIYKRNGEQALVVAIARMGEGEKSMVFEFKRAPQ